jgi:selenocysteine-specific elongation factor
VGTLGWRSLAERVVTTLSAYHGQFPLRLGMPKEELKSRLALAPRVFSESMARWLLECTVAEDGTVLRLPSHSVRFTPQQEQRIAQSMAALAKVPYTPPSRAELERDLAPDVVQGLLDLGRLVKVSEDVLFLESAYREMVQRVVMEIQEKGATDVATVRDIFNTSRKYAIALMEHLDTTHVTRREGDARVLVG